MKKIVVMCLLAGTLSGCYTRLILNQYDWQPPVQKISYLVDTLTGDTTKVVHQADTIVGGTVQNGYWAQNTWEAPGLRLDDSYYSPSWYTFNDYPWWYGDRNIYYNDYGRSYSYGRGFYNSSYYNGGRETNTSNGNTTAVKHNPRRTSSSAVPYDPAIRSAPVEKTRAPETQAVQTAPPPPAQQQSSQPSGTGSNDNGGRNKPTRNW